jgi:hypothetical protein
VNVVDSRALHLFHSQAKVHEKRWNVFKVVQLDWLWLYNKEPWEEEVGQYERVFEELTVVVASSSSSSWWSPRASTTPVNF